MDYNRLPSRAERKAEKSVSTSCFNMLVFTLSVPRLESGSPKETDTDCS